MPTQRVFLDWTGPALPAAADWLLGEPAHPDHLLVMPGSRAGRRLMELLLIKSDGHLVDPPTITTIGSLAEKLITDLPPITCPSALQLVLVRAVQQLDEDALAQITPAPPDKSLTMAWLSLINPIERLFNTLGSAGLVPSHVMQQTTDWPDFNQHLRWETITQIHDHYVQLLAENDLHDLNIERINALEQGRIQYDGPITLVGTVDMNRLTAKMLDAVADHCTALIHAPQSHQSHFGSFGQLHVEHWHKQPLTIPSQMRIVANQPTDQIAAMLSDLQTITDTQQLNSDQLTLGVADEQLGTLVEQLTQSSGLASRWHQPRDILLSRPVSLLTAIAQFAQSSLTMDLTVLLRHPDLQQYLYLKLPALDHTQLDQYMSEHLQNRISDKSPGMGDKQQTLLAAHEHIQELIKKHLTTKGSLAHWAQQFSELLSEIYADQQLVPHKPDDAILIEPLTHIANVLRDWFTSPTVVNDIAGDLDMQQAVELLRGELANTPLPSPGAEPVAEILGWLELHMDDAPHLYILNFNEGFVPSDVKIDPFLPDSICEKLGLTCDKSRLARDRYMLEALIHSQKHLRLIAGQVNLRNEPMLPSRLMLQCPENTLARTVIDYFDAPVRFDPPLLPSGDRNEFLLPKPVAPSEPITSLSVTKFRDYLQCPYRFYLKHVRKLGSVEAYVPELSSMAIGNLAHHIFETFGKSDLIDETNPVTLEQYFSELLDKFCNMNFGKNPLPAVVIQREQLRLRLSVFAKAQARMRADDWRIIPEKIESKYEVPITIDQHPFTLVGRIDRMDRHQVTGMLRIMDYKTSESSFSPIKKHQVKNADGEMQWVDLQLPLYRILASPEIYDDKVELGYIQLGKKLDKIGFDPAGWTTDELDDAFKIAQDIIRQIRQGIYWPPKDPPMFDDGLGGICQDAYPYRQLEPITAMLSSGGVQ
ncbi:MAG TPA: hypothetical protein DCM28_12705 [Phycisphaerales bacterium]|nr:hypothetical protein [Phycisphaerales bacterium]